MGWRDDLQPASWRGVPFVVSAGAIRRGRRTALHEYPYRDPVWVEDLGRDTRRYAFRGFLVGDDVAQQLRQMLDAMEAEGPGELVHPLLGAVQCSLVSQEAPFSAEAGRVVELSFEFVEGAQPEYPAAQQDTGAAVDQAADDADHAADLDHLSASDGADILEVRAGTRDASTLSPEAGNYYDATYGGDAGTAGTAAASPDGTVQAGDLSRGEQKEVVDVMAGTKDASTLSPNAAAYYNQSGLTDDQKLTAIGNANLPSGTPAANSGQAADMLEAQQAQGAARDGTFLRPDEQAYVASRQPGGATPVSASSLSPSEGADVLEVRAGTRDPSTLSPQASAYLGQYQSGGAALMAPAQQRAFDANTFASLASFPAVDARSVLAGAQRAAQQAAQGTLQGALSRVTGAAQQAVSGVLNGATSAARSRLQSAINLLQAEGRTR